jgi:DHA1 family tetracycline resistance protein-like MFS transporter
MSHSLLDTLRDLRGNARGAVLTEPLWGIPFNLYAPYASIYMLAIGLTHTQVGLVVSTGLAGQIGFALLSGIITDKLGRKRATLVFDILAWTIPCLLWASAQSLVWFLAAGLINSLRRIPDISWNCILVEDADPRDLVHIYSWVYLAGQISVFFVPLAGLLIDRFTLVPTVRGLYLLACMMMTAKFVIMNALVTETRQGRVRMEQTRGRSVVAMLGEYRGVARKVLAAPHTLYTIGLMAIVSIVTMVQSTFWAILVTERIHIPAGQIALYPFVRSLLMLFVLFFVVPRLRGVHFGRPMTLAFVGFLLSQIVLVTIPPKGVALLLLSTLLESASYAVLGTQVDRLAVINVDPEERARIVSIAHVVVIACTTPFGWIAGLLSERNPLYPFVLNMALLALGTLFVHHLRATGSDIRADPSGI